jgi:hypothetical protein
MNAAEETTDTAVAALPQGDVALLTSEIARRLLTSTELARLAYLAPDGTPRVLSMYFHWTGAEFVMSTFAGAHKIAALRANPAVAITIDSAGPPPEVLLLRGEVSVTDVDGVVPEYVLAHRRYGGEEQAAAALAEIDHPGMKMARIALRPAWVGLLDFQTRFPGGGAADFENRGRS